MRKIAQFTDLHLDDFLAQRAGIDARRNLENTLNLAHGRGISEVILTGDLGEPGSALWLFDMLRSRGFGFHIVLGNHDQISDFHGFEFLAPLLKSDGLYYSKKIDGFDFECLFLDSSAEEIGQSQLDWLGRQVSLSHSPLVVFVHHPVLDCGNTIADRLFPLKNRDVVRPILNGGQRPIFLFCGHYHFRNAVERVDENLHQFLTPSIFGQIKQYGDELEPDPGYIAYREIWIAEGVLHTEVVEVK